MNIKVIRNRNNQLEVLKICGLPSKQEPYNFPFIYELVKYYPDEIKVIFLVMEPFFILKNKRVFNYERKEYLSPSPNCTIIPAISYLIPIVRKIYSKAYIELLAQFRAIIREQPRFDLIHADFVYPQGYEACIIGRLLKRPVVITSHGSDLMINVNKKWIVKRRSTYALNKAQAIICVSKVLKEKAVSLGADKSKIFVIPNGADTSRFKPIPQNEVREKLNLQVNRKIILFIGRLHPIKGPNFLIDAISQIVNEKKQKELLLILIGSGSMETRLKEQVTSLNISHNVLFAGGITHKEIPCWINASDVVCVPSQSEGFPAVSVEALACGKPVIASNVGGLPEIITNNDLGYLVEPGDTCQLADAIKKALSREWDTDKIARYALERYSWQTIAQSTTDVYKFAIDRFSNPNTIRDLDV